MVPASARGHGRKELGDLGENMEGAKADAPADPLALWSARQ